jgi:hypothetical protein
VAEFLRYLEVKPRYDAIAQAELAEVSGLGEEPVESILAELFHARLLPDGADSGLGALARGWHEFVELERRFGGAGPPGMHPGAGPRDAGPAGR